jgi:DNA-directed RNA polymerase subunit F
MEIVTIEARVFEKMLRRLEDAAQFTEAFCEKHREKRMGKWMDNQEACILLDVTPRTLQTLRDNGTLAYSQISHKIYYKPEDIQGILPVVQRRKEAQA